MLRIILTSATILISVTAAQAQCLPGSVSGPYNRDSYGNPCRDSYGNPKPDYYGNVATDRQSPYQPYVNTTPHYDPYHPRTNNGTSYGDDDDR